MCVSSPSMPSAPPPTPTVAPSNPAVQAQVDAIRRRQAMAAGLSATMLTGGAGVGPAVTAPKTLVGS